MSKLNPERDDPMTIYYQEQFGSKAKVTVNAVCQLLGRFFFYTTRTLWVLHAEVSSVHGGVSARKEQGEDKASGWWLAWERCGISVMTAIFLAA